MSRFDPDAFDGDEDGIVAPTAPSLPLRFALPLRLRFCAVPGLCGGAASNDDDDLNGEDEDEDDDDDTSGDGDEGLGSTSALI